MTTRHVCNQTSQTVRRHVVSQTLETQADGVAIAENSPINVNVDGDAQLVFKAHEWRPCGAEQSTIKPVLISAIPNLTLTQDVLMTPYDTSVHFVGQVDTYALTLTPTGLSFDTGTGILSGTPTSTGSTNPLVTATNVNGDAASNVFNIAVIAP